ncbi:MAG TPA: ribosome maturation factor RimP [Firmicutes bacterium]|jgi:ribosome maturation factor RimP|nr:ribosome maturation factor RimP [Bacillota bacterium]
MAEPIAAGLKLEIVDVEYVREGGQNVLRFLIDKEGGITLDDCEALSRLLDIELDRIDPIEHSYVLQVSSPGIERPLKKKEDYQRFSGRRACLRLYAPLEGRKVFEGTIVALQDSTVLLGTDENIVVRIPLEKVAKANLVYED